MNTTVTPDITALCAAIDAGDDGCLPILADAMEEVGDPRADGVRLIRDEAPRFCCVDQERDAWLWVWEQRQPKTTPSSLTIDVCRRLQEVTRTGSAIWWFGFDTRSAAYLALAEALIQQ